MLDWQELLTYAVVALVGIKAVLEAAAEIINASPNPVRQRSLQNLFIITGVIICLIFLPFSIEVPPNPFKDYGSYWGALLGLYALIVVFTLERVDTQTVLEIARLNQRRVTLLKVNRRLLIIAANYYKAADEVEYKAHQSELSESITELESLP